MAQGEPVRALVTGPSGASGVTLGQRGTVLAGRTSASIPQLIEWEGWVGGHGGFCSTAMCGGCTDTTRGRWWTGCTQFETNRFTCTCNGAFAPGDRVVALVNSPTGASGISQGHQGTVVGGHSSGPTNILVSWDGWTSGHENCSFADCGQCDALAPNTHWWVGCADIGRAP